MTAKELTEFLVKNEKGNIEIVPGTFCRILKEFTNQRVVEELEFTNKKAIEELERLVDEEDWECVGHAIDKIMEERELKNKLLKRGFTSKVLLNNRGLIGACLDEFNERLFKTLLQFHKGEIEVKQHPTDANHVKFIFPTDEKLKNKI